MSKRRPRQARSTSDPRAVSGGSIAGPGGLMNEDGAAAVVAELIGVCGRNGSGGKGTGERFLAAIEQRIADLPKPGGNQ